MKAILQTAFLATLSQAFVPAAPTTIRPAKSALDLWKSNHDMRHFLTTGIVAASLILADPAHAASKVVGQLQGSGVFFKDTLTIERFEDPKVQGVTLYISNFQRPITERLNTKNMFSDPSYASVACAKTGPVKIANNIEPSGEEVFEESRSILFKTLRVQRIYDAEKQTVVYVSYNTRLDKNDDDNKSRFKSSLCAVNLDDGTSTSGAQSSTTTTSNNE